MHLRLPVNLDLIPTALPGMSAALPRCRGQQRPTWARARHQLPEQPLCPIAIEIASTTVDSSQFHRVVA